MMEKNCLLVNLIELRPNLVLLNPKIQAECNVPLEEAGILFDGICFFFLLLQRRIFTSHYFKHVIAEFRAQQVTIAPFPFLNLSAPFGLQVFASRGFELISQITAKEMGEQRAKEQEIVDKIKRKMEKIKQGAKKGASPATIGGKKLLREKSQIDSRS